MLNRFSRRRWRVVMGAITAQVLLVAAAARGGVTPTFNSGASSVTITHNPGTPGGGSPFVDLIAGGSIVNGTAVLAAPFNPHTDSFSVGQDSVSSTAKAGIARTQSTTTAKDSFASGTGVDQVDPEGAESMSIVRIDFNLVWDIASGSFGPPIIGNFSIPVGVVVGAGGSANFSCTVHWNGIINNAVTNNLRAPYSVSANYGPGSTLTSYTAPAAAFSPSSLSFAAGKTNELILNGFVQFGSNDPGAPTLIEIPTTTDPTDPYTQFGTSNNLTDVTENGVLINDPADLSAYYLQLPNDGTTPTFDSSASFDEVPEPSALLALMGGLFLLPLGRRRAAGR